MGILPFMQRWQPHQPDFERFRRSLIREGSPGRVPFAEFLVDCPIIEQLTGKKLPFTQGEKNLTQATIHRVGERRWVEQFVDVSLEFSLLVGMDYQYIELDTGIPLAQATLVRSQEAGRDRNWWYVNPDGRIASWEDFQRFPWPTRTELDYSLLEYACQVVPDGMKILAQIMGLFEPLYCLVGLERLSFSLYEEPDLVHNIIARVAELVLSQVEVALQHEQVGGIWMGDDLGFNSGTFVSPQTLREFIFPWYKRIVDLSHNHEHVFFLHSCGNLSAVMDDLIDLGIDAKHSFEDKIQPVEEAHAKWGDRLGIIGGVDMDILARGTTDDVRRRSREILDACGSKGGYALGTGNSVADYIPAENFLAMLDEGRLWNECHYGS